MAIREDYEEFVINDGNTDVRVICDFNKMSWETRDTLEEKVIDIRKKGSLYFKYPFEEGETNEKWVERVSKLNEEEFSRKEDESVEDHLKRMFSSSDTRQTVIDIFNAISSTFINKTFTGDQLKKCSWVKTKKFLYRVLTSCGIPAGDMRPADLGK